MKETLFATYERKSTLWKNANAFYVAQDWTKMECLYADYSDDRKEYEGYGDENSLNMTVINNKTGEDITGWYVENYVYDRYVVRLTNKRGTNSKSWAFRTKEEANNFYKTVVNHKNINGWYKVC